MAEADSYSQRWCLACKRMVLTPKYCYNCGVDITDSPRDQKCAHCGNRVKLLSELSDRFCRACGKEAKFVDVNNEPSDFKYTDVETQPDR